MRLQKTLTLLMLVMGLASAVPAWAQQKPFTRDQVQGLVRDGLGDESGAKLIEQRGIDFAPAEDFLQSLTAAGGSEAFLKALRAAKPPEPASPKKPLNQVQVFALLAAQVSSRRVAMLVNERGIDFQPQQDYLEEVRLGGGEDELITALKSTKVTKPVTVDPAAQARQAEIRRHVARGAEFLQKKRYADAEAEDRAALRLDPQNANLHMDLGTAIAINGNLDRAIAEYVEALRLDPANDNAHVGLGVTFGLKRDHDAEIAEYREALRLNPSNEAAHDNLGAALADKGDLDEAIGEFFEAVRLNPKNGLAHVSLGMALGRKGDSVWEIAEYREALRLNPNNPTAHSCLGLALELTGDARGALQEYRAAYELDPQDADYRKAYERLSKAVNH